MNHALQALWSGSDPYGEFILAIYVFLLSIIFLVAMIPTIAQYIITSLGLYRLGKKHGVPHAGVAWLPIGDVYVLGSLADIGTDHNGAERTGYRKRLVGLAIPLLAISAVMILSLLSAVFIAIIMGLMGTLPETPTGLILVAILICYGGFVPMFILGIKSAICMYKGLWQIYRMYSQNMAIVYLLLSIFVPFSMGIILLSLVGKETTPPVPSDAEDSDIPTFYSA